MNATGSIDHFRRQWQTQVAAAEYDMTYPAERPRNQWQLLERIKADLMRDLLISEGYGPGSSVLECGCGAAGIGIDLGLQGWRVTGLDVSEDALEMASQNAASHGLGEELKLLVGRVEAPPVPDGSFDVVTSFGLLEHFEDMGPAMEGMVRTLRPGGLFVAEVVSFRPSALVAGRLFDMAASASYHLAGLRMRKALQSWRKLVPDFYEKPLGRNGCRRVLEQAGLTDVRVWGIRPFPPLALPGSLEQKYMTLMDRASSFVKWFDSADNVFTNAWGWSLMAVGVKPSLSDQERPNL